MNPADFAPLLLLHPQEDCFPVDPMSFIARSRFRHHRGWGDDQGWNKSKKEWQTNNDRAPDYYNIPLAVINSFQMQPGNKNRRPRDPNCGNDHNVFLETDTPFLGSNNFNGQVPAFYWHDIKASQIQYWFFYGYNRGLVTESPINHQGDWEHVRVTYHDNTAIGIELSAHDGRKYYSGADIERIDNRFVVFVARGTHAMYPKAGDFPHHTIIKILGKEFSLHDYTAAGGRQWETWLKLEALETQPWRDYAGAWGAIGELEMTTGPLGPWHKRS